MTIRAYDESYLNDAMNNLGDMFDYALCTLKYQPDMFYAQFVVSGIASYFENGNPKYIAGSSGPELAHEIVWRTEGTRLEYIPNQSTDKSPEYWSGWILAYYQWYSTYRFDYLNNHGLTMSKILSLYTTLHEADVSKFVDVANKILKQSKSSSINILKKLRHAFHITQRELSVRSGVSLRMIQLYEQNRQDIRKAEAESVINLSKALGCQPADLLE